MLAFMPIQVIKLKQLYSFTEKHKSFCRRNSRILADLKVKAVKGIINILGSLI